MKDEKRIARYPFYDGFLYELVGPCAWRLRTRTLFRTAVVCDNGEVVNGWFWQQDRALMLRPAVRL